MEKVVCCVVGTGRVLLVDIDAWRSVRELKEKIKAKYPDSIHREAKNLELFLAKKNDNKWLKGENAAAVSLDEDGVLQGFEHMDLAVPLDNVKYFGGNFQQRDGQIHVLVVVPVAEGEGQAETTLTAELARVETEVPGQKRQRTDTVVEFTALVQNLDRATDLEVGKVLAVPREVFGVSLDNGLYIRQEYWDLHGIIEKKLASDKHLRRVLVVGSPGIGTSVFWSVCAGFVHGGEKGCSLPSTWEIVDLLQLERHDLQLRDFHDAECWQIVRDCLMATKPAHWTVLSSMRLSSRVCATTTTRISSRRGASGDDESLDQRGVSKSGRYNSLGGRRRVVPHVQSRWGQTKTPVCTRGRRGVRRFGSPCEDCHSTQHRRIEGPSSALPEETIGRPGEAHPLRAVPR